MTMKDDHATYANGLTLVRLRVAQNNAIVRLRTDTFKGLEKDIAEAETAEAFSEAVRVWAKFMEQCLKG